MDDGQTSSGDLAESIGPAPPPDALELKRLVAQAKARLLGDAEMVSIGRYEIRRWLGAGAFGTVYAAHDPQMRREVAIKVLRHSSASASSGPHETLRAEARAQARVEHRNVAAVLDVGSGEGRTFVVMPLLRGGDLGTWCDGGHPVDDVLRAIVEAGQGLAAAHAAGLVHCDVKPSNLLRTVSGEIQVCDFGLARSETRDRGGGTPRYMAPEQRAREPFDAKADQFALAMVATELLTGAVPTERASMSRPVPQPVAAVLSRALRFDPTARYPSMDAFVVALDAARRGRSRTRILGGRGLVAMVVVGLGVALAGVVRRDARDECTVLAEADDLAARTMALPAWAAGQQALAGRFERSGESGATESFARLQDRVGAYAQRWVESMGEVCEAPPSGARRDCLRLLRTRASRTLTDLVGAPTPELATAAGAFVELTNPGACGRGTVPLTAGDRRAAAVLDRAGYRLRSGDLAGAHADVEGLLAPESAAFGGFMRAEVLYLSAKIAIEQGDDERAIERYEECYVAAFAANHEWMAAEAALNMAGFSAERQRFERAEAWLQLADSVIERAGRPPELEAAWFNTAMGLQSVTGQRAAAVESGRRAVALLRALPSRLERRMTARRGLAMMLLLDGQGVEAETVARDALAEAERGWGPDSVRRAELLDLLAGIMASDGRQREAMVIIEEAIALFDRRFGRAHPASSRARFNLAELLLHTGQPDAAIAVLEAVVGATQGSATTLEARALHRLGQARWADGQRDAAYRSTVAAVVAYGSLRGPPALHVGEVHELLGRIEATRGEHDAARRAYARAIAELEAADDADALARVRAAERDLGQSRAEPAQR